MISKEQLNKFSVSMAKFYPELVIAAQEFDITTDPRMAAFLAQIAHESLELTRWEENLNYSADRLRAVWPSRFTAEKAASYARKPEAIANFVYSNRMGNGDEASGEGWKYRGRSPIQLTGKDNYSRCGAALNVDLVKMPERAAQRDCGLRVAGWFWSSNGLNALADAGKFDTITQKINGGQVGKADRVLRWDKAKQILAVR